MADKHIGTVAQIMGPVLDIRFKDGELPELLNAVRVESGGRTLICEVAQHIGGNRVVPFRARLGDERHLG